MSTAPSIRTCLWFETGAEEAAQFYVTLFEDAAIEAVHPASGPVFLVQWQMAGQRFSAMNGGPHYTLTPAASIEVHLESQAEVDRLWDALLEGGTAMRCGWLTDRWGVSWQIVPRALPRLMQHPDAGVRARVQAAMLEMVKLDGPALEAAAAG